MNDHHYAVSSLRLSHFRSYEDASLVLEKGRSVVLVGENGAGKTNVLEALSLFAPGRGFRKAKLSDFKCQQSSSPLWAVSMTLEDVRSSGKTVLSTGNDPEKVSTSMDSEKQGRRLIKVDGEILKGQGKLAEYVRFFWLTPQMDLLFSEGTSTKRRFLDRLVYGFDKEHAKRVLDYEQAVRERLKVLKTSPAGQEAWLTSLEKVMSEQGVAIVAARKALIAQLSGVLEEEDFGVFPRGRLMLEGEIERWLDETSALEVETLFMAALHKNRAQDKRAGKTLMGAHKTDLKAWFAPKDLSAEFCSTGEQKSLLIAIMLAYVRLQEKLGLPKPILLLDEIASHLDKNKRESLFKTLEERGVQAWYTGTDEEIFEELRSSADFYCVEGGVLKKDVKKTA
ncbi:MAG: DNA replication/repair protein RecF [Alphaproteobacteria bacterium]